MEPSDSTSTTTSMEEPDSLEVLVKTLDSQTRTFIVGAQVRPRHFWKTLINSSSYRPLILREEPDFFGPQIFFNWFLCSYFRQEVFWSFLLSEKVWLLLNEADFVLPFSTLIELSAEGNVEEGRISMPSS